MSLDLRTLFVIAVFVSAVAGLLLLVSWLQNRKLRGLALWASAFIIGSIGVSLIAARGHIPDTWSIAVANAILALAYGMLWAGVRNVDGRATSAPLVLAGAVIWLVACHNEAFFASTRARTALMSALVVAYSLLSAWELWRGRREGLMFRLPVILLLLVHTAFFVARIPLAWRAAAADGFRGNSHGLVDFHHLRGGVLCVFHTLSSRRNGKRADGSRIQTRVADRSTHRRGQPPGVFRAWREAAASERVRAPA